MEQGEKEEAKQRGKRVTQWQNGGENCEMKGKRRNMVSISNKKKNDTNKVK